VTTMSTSAVRVAYSCGDFATQLVRTQPTFAPMPTNCAWPTPIIESGLPAGTTYCYEMRAADGSVVHPAECARTLYEPFVFQGPGLSQAESDQMAATFNWAHTEAVAATLSNGETALYSMNILVKNSADLYGLRGLGIHTQTQPLFQVEQDASSGTLMQAMVGGEPAGAWITAIVPGPIYNDLRWQAIDGLASGNPIGIEAMVFRRIHQPGAGFYPDGAVTVNPIDPTFIGQQGITYNGYSSCWYDEDLDLNLCQVEQALFGWLANKLLTIVLEVVDQVVDSIRQFIGGVVKLIKGEVLVTVQLVLHNSDPGFGVTRPLVSGWNAGAPLVLKHLPIKIYQGVSLFTGTTNASGFATVEIAKNSEAKVCIDLENDRIEIIDSFTERRICVDQRIPGTATPITVTLTTADKHANLLATMTDAADYLAQVMDFDMPKVAVLTGWQSSLVNLVNSGRSFAPCMGRMPNLPANLAIYSGAVVSSYITLLGEIAEFFTAYDIVMAGDDVASRGVGVHEYGHAAMCELLRDASQVDAQIAWAHVIVASLTGQSASMQESMIAEGFADFLAAQVVGGTNYFNPSPPTRSSGKLTYCLGNSTSTSACLEPNAPRCDHAACDKSENINYVASLLQDVFDRVPLDLAQKINWPVGLANDGSLWSFDGTAMTPHPSANQVSAADADTIQLAGPKLASIFAAWSARGTTLSYDSFLGGVAQVLKDEGFDVTAVCNLFAAHEPSGSPCPAYVIDVFGTVPPPPPPPAAVDRFAYALADQPAAAEYHTFPGSSHSGAAAPIRITRSATGRYRVLFENLPASGAGLATSVAVTAVAAASISCSAGDVMPMAGSTAVDVVCWDHALARTADAQFSILLVGNDGLPPPSAFLASGGNSSLPALDPTRSWTSGRWAQSVTASAAAGSYLVNHGVGNAPVSAKLVTARGTTGGERCNDANLISGGLEVRCYDRTGAQAHGQFNAVQVASGKPGRRFGVAFVYQPASPTSLPHPEASYSSAQQPMTVTRASLGRTTVELVGLQKPQPDAAENVQVTALSTLSAQPVTCNLVGTTSTATALRVDVECRRGTALVDARYQVVVVE
jgi:hypothetical protein